MAKRPLHIILCHSNASQTSRLAERLLESECFVVFHVCLNASQAFQKNLTDRFGHYHNVSFSTREDGSWGEFGIVQGTINAIAKGDEIYGKDISHFNLLSGQDYPIKPLSEFNTFLSGNQEKDFVEAYHWYPKLHDDVEVDHPWRQSKHLQHLRLEHYYYRVGTNRIAVPEKYTDRYRGGFISRLADLARSLPSMARNRQRAREEWFLFKQTNRHHFPRPIPPYQFYNGSQWWTMSASSARYVLSTYTSLFNDLTEHAKFSMLSDEFFFQTLLKNSPHSEKVQHNNLREIQFALDQRQSKHPRVFQKDSLRELLSSQHFFARKFNNDCKILDLLDEKHR